MADEVKLYTTRGSPYCRRVEIGLILKGVKYETINEDLNNKSPDLLKYNPIHKTVPVLLHNGNPIPESLVILEYVDDVWKQGLPILPNNPYDKALARFWAKFIDDKIMPAILKACGNKGDLEALAEAREQVQILENELAIKRSRFFGGDSLKFVDLSAIFIAYWLEIMEEATQVNIVTKDKFPKITEWAHEFVNHQVVKQILPPKPYLLSVFKAWFAKP